MKLRRIKWKYDIDKLDVDRDELVDAINGNAGLGDAFFWHETPQGYEYWSDQVNRKIPLDTQALQDILDQYDAQSD